MPTMPHFQSTLPPEQENHGYKLRRTPETGSLIGIVTSDDLVTCDTHWWHGRTCPCERETTAEGKTLDDSRCPACRAKTPYRTHAYVAAFDLKTRLHFIFECTAQAAKPLADFRAATGTLRGCAINASRSKAIKNSKVNLICNATNLARNPIPTAPDVPAALCVIWRVPRTGWELQLEHEEAMASQHDRKTLFPAVRTRGTAMDEMHEQVDNAADPPTIGEIINGNGRKKKEAAAK